MLSLKKEREWPPYSFVGLFASIAFLLVLHPLVKKFLGVFALALMLTFVLLSSIYSISNDRKLLKIGALLALPSLILNTAFYWLDSIWLDLPSGIFVLLFFIYVIAIYAWRIFFTSKPDPQFIYGAITIYFLTGICWGLLYRIIEGIAPHSFHGITHGIDSATLSIQFDQLLYYSFVTLTTLGYGDIVPAGDVARTVAILEAIFGQFYIAALVASLVGKITMQKTGSKD